MPRQRSESEFVQILFGMLCRAPIWLGPVLAAAVFFAVRYVAPQLTPDSVMQAAKVSQVLAVVLSVAVLGAWVAAEVWKFSRRGLLGTQRNLDTIRNLSWQQFEHLVGEAFRQRGYRVEERGGSGGDGGVDLVVAKDNRRTLIQCKQWRQRRVGVKPVRELYGVMVGEQADRAVLACTGAFTREAERFAEGKPITLMTGEELWTLVESVQPDRGDAGQPPARSVASGDATPDQSATQIEAPIACPRCGSPTIERTARRGLHAGKPFWGCSRYPACRGIAQT